MTPGIREQPSRIVVVGSINVDMIVRSERLPRPGETVVGDDLITAGGGKGANQAVAARRLGAEVAFVGRLGADASGRFARERFQESGLETTWLRTDPDAATGVALILVDRDGQNMIGVAPGANHRLTADDVRQAGPAFAASRVLVTQLEIPLDAVVAALNQARALGMTTILNPAPGRAVSDEVLELVDWLTPNETEAGILADQAVEDRDSAIQAAKRLLQRGAKRVVVTRGAQGAVYVTRGEDVDVVAYAVPSVDATAAGDAFTAALAVSLGRGQAPADALHYASAAGALTTTRPGAQPSLPTHAEVTALLAGSAAANPA